MEAFWDYYYIQKNLVIKNQLIVTKNVDYLYYSLISENFKGTELRIFFDKEFKELKGWNIIENNETTIKIKILFRSLLKSII